MCDDENGAIYNEVFENERQKMSHANSLIEKKMNESKVHGSFPLRPRSHSSAERPAKKDKCKC